ncbi:hypothetical protein ACQCVK_17245 [Rossellomorea vietnamensis]|nr:hypothetical protein [Rossellomorea aquimaris]
MYFLTPEEIKAKKARQKLLVSIFTVLALVLVFTGITFLTYGL